MDCVIVRGNGMTPREKLIARVGEMTDEQVEAFLKLATLIGSEPEDAPYDEDNDPTIGFMSASPDFASTSSDVLRRELYGISDEE